ncbi:hypothetical protein PVAP13_1NG242400 [Panicum virgatum]|uniref:Inositol-tetrakisphosphate 1-kinase n=1 Tax=Panicum virgatum TaxID=38727 RepID=A0A8T0WWX6_PANVG|nr:hypothetical protein PVAP13_1NG242400 [Panicum virgatum]
MAAQSSSPADSGSSSPRPHTNTIGYAMLPNKHDTFVQPSFLDLAARHGVRLEAVDASRPLVEQGPFDLIVHKLYGQAWHAQLEAFSALHPESRTSPSSTRPPPSSTSSTASPCMLDVVAGLGVAREGAVATPRQVIVADAAALAGDDANLAAALGGLRFPLIAKPEEVDGSAASHDLAPVVLQEFVNHGGVLFKVYVVRCSLPDVPDARLHDLAADAAAPFANISLLPPPAAGDAEMPPQDFVDRVASELRWALGLHLINFDLIQASDPDGDAIARYLILDINYCPGYSKMPGFEPVLLDFFLEMLRNRPGLEQPCPGAGSGSGLGAKALKAEVEPSFTPSGVEPKQVHA